MSNTPSNEEFMDAEETLDNNPPRRSEVRAEEEKNKGNTYYKNKDYYSAIRHYTNAINTLPDKAAYYGNRSAAYMMVNNYSSALDDANKSIAIDPNFIKGSVRVLKCHIAMGNITAASRTLEDLKTRDPNNSSTYVTESTNINRLKEFQNSATETMSKGDFRKVVFVMDRALELAPACVQYKVQRAECLVCLGRYGEAEQAANDILRSNNTCSGALYVKGLSLFYQDNIEKARKFFVQVLRVDPDHNKAKIANKRAKDLEQTKQKGNAAFTSGKHEEALKLYTDALLIDPNNRITNAKLHCNMAAVRMKLNQWDNAVQSCNKAIDLDENYVKAYIRRALCYQELDKHEEAVRDCEKVHNMEHSRESKQRLRDANFKLKLSKRKDYYKILNVSKHASEDEIKKGYKKAALKFHPDRHSAASDDEKAQAEVKFKEVGEAYSVLSDPNKRRRYDNGEDLDDPMSGMNIDPTQIFETMFGGGGGFPGGSQFFSSRGGHGPGFTFSFG